MPDKVVAMHLQSVLLGKRNMTVCIGKGEVPAGRLGGFPFLRVLGGDGVEVLVDDCGLGGFVAQGQGGANEGPVTLAHGMVEGVVFCCIVGTAGALQFVSVDFQWAGLIEQLGG